MQALSTLQNLDEHFAFAYRAKCHSRHSPILFAELTASAHQKKKGPRKPLFTASQDLERAKCLQ